MQRLKDNAIKIDDDICVYTIISPERLIRAASKGKPLLEKSRWVKAEKLFRQGRQLAVIFADARNCRGLLAWSVLKQIMVRETGTEFTVTKLYDVGLMDRGKLTVVSTAKPIPKSHIRPYVICKTPRLLKAFAKRPVSWAG